MSDTTDTVVNGDYDDDTGRTGARLKQTAEELRSEVTREVNQRAQQVRDWAEVQADTVRTTVVDKPFASAGAAFAAGVILGVLLARR